jgi:hypothetical protein
MLGLSGLVGAASLVACLEGGARRVGTAHQMVDWWAVPTLHLAGKAEMARGADSETRSGRNA